MDLKLTSMSGDAAEATVELSDASFALDFNEALIHQVVTAHLAGARSGTKAQKSRSDVRGGGAKPWRQKGTGRARSGTIRSPIWRSGGVTFAASPRDFSQKVNKKMYRAAIRSILSELVRQERLIVVDDFSLEAPKTKMLNQKLKDLGVNNSLIVTSESDDNLYLASRNLIGVEAISSRQIDPVRLVGHEKVIMTVTAVKAIEEALA